jgi:hypothetical protein
MEEVGAGEEEEEAWSEMLSEERPAAGAMAEARRPRLA